MPCSHRSGSGKLEEVGKGRGMYFTVNVPLKDGIGDRQYVDLFTRFVCTCYTGGAGGGGIWEDTCRPGVTDATKMQYEGQLNFVTFSRMLDCCTYVLYM